MLSDKIFLIRQQYNYSQEKFAEKLGLSRQAIQRWESGAAMPDLDNMINIAKIFNVSLDWLNDLSDHRTSNEMRHQEGPIPSYQDLDRWIVYGSDLLNDFRQALDEGRDVESLREIVEAISEYKDDADKEELADTIYKIMYHAPMRQDYPYREPNDIAAIRLLRTREKTCFTASLPDEDVLRDKLTAAWRGRVCGCMLGQPIECIKTYELWPLLQATDNWPLHRYITSTDVQHSIANTIEFPLRTRTYADMLTDGFMGDDDINYTFMAAYVIDRYGRDFTSNNVCDAWKHTQVMYAYATAEKVAYRNMIAGYTAPGCALYKNPFREWIGAQIRGDYFGYINPGDPESAAEMAWRDARISHVKNGIYGEMFSAAMNAAAMVTDSVEEVVLSGMSQIPSTSRLYEGLSTVLKAYHAGEDWDTFLSAFLKRYNELDPHDFVHTIPNAMLVAAALLWGEGDFSKTICLAVQGAFDTDCNGATAGSVIGMMVGTKGIDTKWTDPIGDRVYTTVYNRSFSTDEFVGMMLQHINLKNEGNVQ